MKVEDEQPNNKDYSIAFMELLFRLDPHKREIVYKEILKKTEGDSS